MHKVQPNQKAKLIVIELAVPADTPDAEVSDEISAILTEKGICDPQSSILDWRYITEYRPVVKAGDYPDECEIFVDSPFVLAGQEVI